ncbi:Hypothetical_protein [Hexamita inflata]|uniref:Hypothetical_protein n=1 Tax=Hexamita inflata TaxID=28002 RepID=A0AA86QRV3_9EUKA|nr:Hypothetical protein HINF_LOCUS49572 [Hexamita inflata]
MESVIAKINNLLLSTVKSQDLASLQDIERQLKVIQTDILDLNQKSVTDQYINAILTVKQKQEQVALDQKIEQYLAELSSASQERLLQISSQLEELKQEITQTQSLELGMKFASFVQALNKVQVKSKFELSEEDIVLKIQIESDLSEIKQLQYTKQDLEHLYVYKKQIKQNLMQLTSTSLQKHLITVSAEVFNNFESTFESFELKFLSTSEYLSSDPLTQIQEQFKYKSRVNELYEELLNAKSETEEELIKENAKELGQTIVKLNIQDKRMFDQLKSIQKYIIIGIRYEHPIRYEMEDLKIRQAAGEEVDIQQLKEMAEQLIIEDPEAKYLIEGL